ncbi:MAG TPA: FAD/NAD(P)-binding oxidoreductase, partial [Marmoricola sp.]|nr:FAD/NAD(P)-binding oxidoreductase [Marmoricola sp.]
LLDPRIWRKSAFDFYTLEGATRLRDALAGFSEGRILVHISEMPIKCPVAPLEFAFLADDYFRKRRIRHKVDITYVTPLDGAFTKPVASKKLGGLLEDRSIRVQTDFAVESVDPEKKTLNSFDGRELPFDLLVTVPTNMGAQFVIDSGMGDDLGYVPVDKHTLLADGHDNIFVIGDATNVPTSKAGAVAHFEVEGFTDNFLAAISGQPLPNQFDGHANCFVEAGRGKALLLDFNYETEPLTGHFPAPFVGPMKLLGLSRVNHLGKLAFEHIYWNLLMKGRKLPVPTEMSMVGKVPAGEEN